MEKKHTRTIWLETMHKIAKPVLESLSRKQLKKVFPLEFHKERSIFAPLEAFGRTASGIAPWLELDGLAGEEAKLQKKYRTMMLLCLDAATDPESPDYMEFSDIRAGQPLVDAAFLSHALVRAPKQTIGKLNQRVKHNLIVSLKKTRSITPNLNNWLLFTAMVETALYLLGEPDYDMVRIEYALHMFDIWYKGDSIYGDGMELSCDYYNSFVIYPMSVDIIRVFENNSEKMNRFQNKILPRASRYASILERMIGPDGSYPIIGRSITYRFGAFQMLSQAALQHMLEDSIQPAQVRCALTAVIEKTTSFPDMFDENGWLRPGVCGYQPELAEYYINIGSLYLCCMIFPALGLLETDPFWSATDTLWTGKRAWSGLYTPMDHSI